LPSGRNLLSVSEVPPEAVSKYGIVKPGLRSGNLALGEVDVAGLVEKPDADKAPSRLASFGRYVFDAEIFDVLRRLPPGKGDEIQLADAIDILAGRGRVSALTCQARRYDCGDKFGYLTAIVDLALEHEQFGTPFRVLLADRLG